MNNPFLTSGYGGPEYFCDRVDETKRLTQMVTGGNNVVLMSPRRMGKSGLIQHVFNQEEFKVNYNTFLIDIYATSNITEMTQQLGTTIVRTLAGRGETALQNFLRVVSSLRATMSFDQIGVPTWGVEMGNLRDVNYTLEKIFDYLESSAKPCVVAIDEFQQITRYEEKNVEAILRTRIQNMHNTNFIFSGSERSLLSQMFSSPSRPFYHSTSSLPLYAIPEDSYTEFIYRHFCNGGRSITKQAIHCAYYMFEGVTWYVQRIMNVLYMYADKGTTIEERDVIVAVERILAEESMTYANTLYQLTPRQKQLLVAIAKEIKATAIKGNAFIKKYNLPGASTIQTTIKTLIEKQLVTDTLGCYEVYDKFFAIWLNRNA